MRIAMLLVTAWAMLAAPALCAAGVIAHLCERHGEASCGHESGCQTDPCSERAYRKDTADHDLVSPAGHDTPASSPVSTSPAHFLLSAHCLRHAPSGPTPPLGAPHPSDLPLRI